MLAYLPKVVVIKSLTQHLRAKHLRFSATIPTFPQSLQGPSLKYALILSLGFCLDEQDHAEGGFTSLTLMVTLSPKCSEHCGDVYPLHFPCIMCIYTPVSGTRGMPFEGTDRTLSYFSLFPCQVTITQSALHAAGFW